MSVISRLILVQPDERVRESLRFGFEREGVAVTSVAATDELDPAPFAEPAEVVIAGGRSAEEACAVLAKVRGALVWCGREVPILYLGNGIGRPQAIDEGAAEFLGQPAYVRDAVTVARLLAGRKRENPAVLAGDLGEHFGFYYLVRALSAVKRTGVLTLVRGMRRGEIRFYEGEVTSAQAGLLHGLAAFHQLLLWTEGRFEIRPEDVVRRQQIPLEPDELFADAERFLAEMIAVAGQLSPAAIYERNEQQIARMTGSVPDAVDVVLRLFDGRRTVADVAEDCTFRVFETFRLGNRMCELGLIRLKHAPRTRHPTHAALAIDEWLVGHKAQPAQPDKPAPRHVIIRKSEPIGPPPGQPASPPGIAAREEGGRRKKRRRGAASSHPPPGAHGVIPRDAVSGPGGDRSGGAAARTAGTIPVEPLVIDWVGLLPQPVGGANDSGVSQVVPSSVAAGEISVGPTYPGQVHGDLRARREREAPPVIAPSRERIEEVAPAAELVQLFRAEATAASVPPPVPEPPRVVLAPTPSLKVDEQATTDRLEKVDTHEVSGEIETSGPPPSAAGVIVSAPARAPVAEPQAVPSIVIDTGSAPAAPVSLFDPPPGRRSTPPPIPPPIQPPAAAAPPPIPTPTGEEHAIAVARKAIAEKSQPHGKKSTGGPTHPRQVTPQPATKRRQTKPPLSFSDAEEAFFAQGSKMADSDQPEVDSFEDLDEGMDLPNTFWKRLFRSPTAPASRAPAPPLKQSAPRPRQPSQPGRSSTPPPRRPGPGARKK
jgi:hypothetical protein